jgi:acetyltransferase
VRPIRTDDIERERQFINGLSEATRYSRLMFALREPSPGFLRQMVEIDRVNTMALVAIDPASAAEQFVAVARYSRDESGSAAEFAVVVADAWQGRGIGTRLARLLFDYAARQGIEQVYGTIFANNERMLDLVRHLGMTIEPIAGTGSIVRASLALSAAPAA